jgi:DNA primase catalytic core
MEISEIKASLSITKVLQHYNLNPDRNNRLCCPFHNDKTPSLQVYPKTNTAYCFSSNCKTHGKSLDVIDFVMHKEGCSKHEAILKAQELLGETPPKPKPKNGQDLSRSAVLTKMFSYFKNGLSSSQPAKAYAASRHLDPTKLEMGYNSGQFHHGQRKDKFLIESCLKVGLLLDQGKRSRTGEKAYQPFGKNGLVFALRNREGKITGLYFRNITESKTAKHFYLKDRQGLYPNYPKPETTKLILTEAIIDAGTVSAEVLTKAGYQNYEVLALYGTNGLTDEHLHAIKNLKNLSEVVFWFDGDESGKKAAEKYQELLKSELPKVKLTKVETPKGEDVNSLLDGHDPEILLELLESRKRLGNESLVLFSTETEGAENPVELSASDFSNSIENKSALSKRKNPEPKQIQQLDTSNPTNIIYQGQVAEYQIKGFKITHLDSLKISLQIIYENRDFRTRIELYEYKQTSAVSQKAGEILDLNAALIEKDLGRLATLLEEYREAHQSDTEQNQPREIHVPESTQAECLNLLKSPTYFKRLNELIGKTGITGEETGRLLLYVIASTYKMPDTLHALVQGSSGSGKTHLITKIAELMPPEHTVMLTRVTESSFYNYGENDLKNRLLIMEDLDGLKEEAFLAFRELQSRGMLNSSTSIKDEQGNIRAMVKTVKGPIASLSATTKGEIYEDNMSRSLVIAVDESKVQTLKVVEAQNAEAAGKINLSERKKTILFLQHCMRLIKPLNVVNPFAHRIKLPEEAHKIRRLNQLYQAFVKQITLLHQYQRKRDGQGRLITDKQDLEIACKILFECIVLKVDELDGSLRNYFEQVKKYVTEKGGKEYEFTRREIRQELKVSKSQQHFYMQQLQDYEYLAQANGYANRGFKYKVSYWDSLEALRAKTQEHLEAQLEKL